MTKVVFLWHMHQPYYKDASTNLYLMPWVRLHAMKGYYDVPHSMKKYGVKGVINLVPSLMEQITDYVQNGATDAWLDNTIANPADMKEEDKAFVIRNFFMINWERLVKTSPRYHEILNKRIRYEKKLNWSEMAKLFSNDEIFDLQILFNLKWFGFMAREKYPRLRELDEKDRGFSQKDKEDMLSIQKKIISEIIPLYRDLAAEGAIEISFTPFYHPIFPLVYDTDIASRSSGARLPERFSYPEDAKWHLVEGKLYSEKLWGREISGMWPAEGSVSPEIIPACIEAGVKWIASDEGVLLNSLGTYDKSSVLYRPYRLKGGDEKFVTGFFRDKYLSDLLGFSFSRMEPEKAVDIFMNYVKSTNFNLPHGHPEPVVSIILDGENAWESYEGNGEFFLKALFTRLNKSTEVKTTTFSNIVATEDANLMQPIARVFSGSWINSNYDIWIGSEEDNTAWEYLKRVRDFYSKYKKTKIVTPRIDEEIMRCIYRAEGSDWFWWYGPQFSTENDWLFDRLFRRHLRRVYNLLCEENPTFLDIPISSSSSVNAIINPTNMIKPFITGRVDSYYEWSGAGVFENSRKTGGAMYNSIKLIDKVFYGFDRDNLYFKIQLVDPLSFYEHKRYTLKGFIMNSRDIDFALPMIRINPVDFAVHYNNDAGYVAEVIGAGVAAFEDVLEIKLNSKKTGLKPGEKIKIYFKIVSAEGIELERVPAAGSIDIVIADESTLFTLWDV
ncbi:MAG TPA: glycoside hydrolase family 57 protein [bacterium]|nr:glycoside hydrolase family 57 protein [bacterium]